MAAKVYEQCIIAYEAMQERATGGVYRGYITYLFDDLGLGFSNYTSIIRRLTDMGCVEQIVAGGRSVKSEWRLIQEPTEDLFAANSGRRKSRLAAVEELLEKTTRRVDALQEKYDSLDQRAV